MEWEALFKIIQEWGPSAISSVLVVVVLYLIKRVNAAGAEEKARAESLKAAFETKVRELRDDVTKVIDGFGQRLSRIEVEFVRRETFYRELGGWKDDIGQLKDYVYRVSDQLSSQLSEIRKNIIELWRGQKDQ
jgi:hypothetical protein